MKKRISSKLIRTFNPCYDPSEKGLPETSMSIREWIAEAKKCEVSPKDILWTLCRNEFMTDRNMRLFAVWCAREALKLVTEPDPRSINACDVAEKFANGKATSEEMAAARAAARAAAWETAWTAARAAAGAAAGAAAWAAARAAAWAAAGDTAGDAAWAAARAAAGAAAWDAARGAQIEKLLTYFP